MNNYIKIKRHYTKRLNQNDIWIGARNSGGLHKKMRLFVSIPKVKLLEAFGLIPKTVDIKRNPKNNHEFSIINSGANGYSLMHPSINKYVFWITIGEETEYFNYIDHGDAYDYKFEDGELFFTIKEIHKDPLIDSEELKK